MLLWSKYKHIHPHTAHILTRSKENKIINRRERGTMREESDRRKRKKGNIRIRKGKWEEERKEWRNKTEFGLQSFNTKYSDENGNEVNKYDLLIF